MGQRFGGVAVTFGTGTLDLERNRDRDLILGPREFRAAGLHKPTRFSLNPLDKKELVWCEEYFVAPPYVRGAGLTLGRLSVEQVARMNQCLIWRGLIRA